MKRQLRNDKEKRIRTIISFNGWQLRKSAQGKIVSTGRFNKWSRTTFGRTMTYDKWASWTSNVYDKSDPHKFNARKGETVAAVGFIIPFHKLADGEKVRWAMFDSDKRCFIIRTESGATVYL